MYGKILKSLRAQYPEFPKAVTLDLGLAIKQIRLRMGITQNELAEAAKISPSALKTLENGYAKFTKTSNLLAIARVLRTGPRDILLEAREWFPGNFFTLKLQEGPPETGRRKKYREESGFKRKTIDFEGGRISFVSPPPFPPSSFCFALVELDPGGQTGPCRLNGPEQAAGFVQRGALKIDYAGREFDVFGNQGFAMRGDRPHAFINTDRDNPLRFFLAFVWRGEAEKNPSPSAPAKKILNVGRAIREIRRRYSDAKSRPLSFNELSFLTGLDESALRYLESTTGETQVIYWDKIEQVTRALKIPFASFLDMAEGADPGYFYLATAHDRALIDYRHYLGVRIKSAVFPGTHNAFQLSEMYIEPRGGIRRVSWNRKDHAVIGAYVEDGELRVEAGKNRKAVLKPSESIYFDASSGYIFTNSGPQPAKLVIASFPPIIF